MLDQKIFSDFINTISEDRRQRIIDAYKESLTHHRQQCAAALEAKNTEPLSSSAHDLKSLSYMIGANKLGDLAVSIEKDLEQNKDDAAFEKGPDLLAYIEKTQQDLEQKFKEAF